MTAARAAIIALFVVAEMRMDHNVTCYRCGASLAAFSLPLSRQDECPECGNYLHVCKMCSHFDASIPRQCREDGAEEVTEKDRLNFCDWFLASEVAFDAKRKAAADQARSALDALFDGTGETVAESDHGLDDAEELFKS